MKTYLLVRDQPVTNADLFAPAQLQQLVERHKGNDAEKAYEDERARINNRLVEKMKALAVNNDATKNHVQLKRTLLWLGATALGEWDFF